jgi:CheY-like chemotaxis protein
VIVGIALFDADLRLIPVIALTAHAIAGEREKALDAGCDEYESKPVDFNRLLEKISRFVKLSGSRA